MKAEEVQQQVADRLADECCPECNRRAIAFVAAFWLEGKIVGMSFICREHGIYHWMDKKVSDEHAKAMEIVSTIRAKNGLVAPLL